MVQTGGEEVFLFSFSTQPLQAEERGLQHFDCKEKRTVEKIDFASVAVTAEQIYAWKGPKRIFGWEKRTKEVEEKKRRRRRRRISVVQQEPVKNFL